MSIEIYEYSVSDFIETDDDGQMSDDINSWSIGLWFDDWDRTDVEKIYLAWDDNDIVGFQTVNSSFKTTAIEVKESYRGQDISIKLIEYSECYEPDRNENPEFWARVASEYVS